MSKFSPALWIALLVTGIYLLILGAVPEKNQLPATLGATALIAMAFCIILAARWSWLDRLIGGPDKAYKMHRWLGYSILLTGIGHWILAAPSGEGIVPSISDIAAESGKYAIIMLILLSALAMFRIVPYHIWKHSHFLMGLLFPIIVFHSFFSKIPLSADSIAWWVLLLISLAGIIGWIRTIFRHFSKPARLTVSAIYPVKNGIDIRLSNEANNNSVQWLPGQFATVSFKGFGNEPNETEAHPFTIASAPNSKEIRLVVGDFGYYTGKLIKELRTGDSVDISEVSGSFLPNTNPGRKIGQIWLAGGMGITPFLSALEALVPDHGPDIDLIYCVRSSTYAVDLYRIMDYAKKLPQLTFYLVKEDQEGSFSEETFARILRPGWQGMQLYLCGSVGLKNAARKSWYAHNCRQKIHEEEFDFRNAVGKPISKRSKLEKIRASA